MDKICPHCGGEVIKTSNKEIYGRVYGNGQCYMCKRCRASVGTHDNGKTLGVLATREMKVLKIACHDLFDTVWKSGKISRRRAYEILSEKLQINQYDCHFGYFETEMLLKSISILANPNWYKEVNSND